ncbi:MAG: hypothetical protein HY852_26895 [Bradyrhizobium sp.]|uniref:hypothetical protein n=1 Tax=Bradyrhizobium sp. TaxID=376 RepID=UPI0025B95EFF|nr:hypothetical protein [Bradyrhizobium sp.]MBI5265437.1 hypothetical protein [Bradyrhizobium sp.]
MKTLAFAIAAITLIGTPAFAADMAVKTPPPAPAPVFGWTGFYAGIELGGKWADTTWTTTSIGVPGTPMVVDSSSPRNYDSSAFRYGEYASSGATREYRARRAELSNSTDLMTATSAGGPEAKNLEHGGQVRCRG